MYPSLPTTIEMTEEDKTLRWVNDTNKLTAHGKKANTTDTIPGYVSENLKQIGAKATRVKNPEDAQSKTHIAQLLHHMMDTNQNQ